MGVSPETTEDEIKRTFEELGIGEAIEIKRGVLDSKRLPGVTNGTWALRVKILDPEKVIPSYIHRRDEGELWSLNFEGRVFCCWKCGSGDHIGDKCRDQSRTFEEIFNGSVSDADFVKPSWAAVVRSGNVDNAEQSQRIKEMEAKLKEENKLRDREKRELEERERLKEEEKQKVIEEKQRLEKEERQKVLKEAAKKAEELKESKKDVSDDDLEDDSMNTLLANVGEAGKETKVDSSPVDPEAEAADRNLITAVKHKSWLEARALDSLISRGINIVVPQEVQDLETIFGLGAAQHQLAIEYQGIVNQETGNLDRGGRSTVKGQPIDRFFSIYK